MGFITLKCPSCGADINLDESREFGFCSFCGTKIVQDKQIIEHRGSISIDHSQEINNLLLRAQEMLLRGAHKEAEYYYSKVLDLDATNAIARSAMEKYYKVVDSCNFSLSVTTGKLYNSNIQVQISIDGNKQGSISSNSPGSYMLTAGKHIVTARIANTFSKVKFEVVIADRFTKITRTINCKFGNKIEVQ